MKSQLNFLPVLERIGAHMKKKAIRMCPVDMGHLRQSIGFRIEGDRTVVLFASAPYAANMEYGTPPGLLSDKEKDDVTDWAKRHGIKNAYWVIRSIEKNGIKAGTAEKPLHVTSEGRDSYRPFLRPAVYQSIPEISAMLKGKG
jgi:hypothetical protein